MTGTGCKKLINQAVVVASVGMAASQVTMGQSKSTTDTYSHAVTINREASDVWTALVTKQLVDAYYFVPISDDITEDGQDFHYGPVNQKMIIGSVLELQPPRVFKHSFRFVGNGQANTTVTYRLNAAGRATRVTVTHEGYERDTQPFADIAAGWPIILNGLKAKLEAN